MKLLHTLTPPFIANDLNSSPIWLMRQAGRYLPEYRALRLKVKDFLELCLTPDLAAEITLMPLRNFPLDAAIIFSDILMVPYALGQKLWFASGEGPRLVPLDPDGPASSWHNLLECNYDLWRKRLQPVYQAIKAVARTLPPRKNLIGFAGAPWTLACYMLSGGNQQDNWLSVKQLALRRPEVISELYRTLEALIVDHLDQQILAGCDVVQLFDSWAGVLPMPYLRDLVFAPTARIVKLLKMRHPNVPIIGFPRGIGNLVVDFAKETEVDAISIDHNVNHQLLRREIRIPIQGGIDPELLLIGGSSLRTHVHSVMAQYQGHPYVVNLSHGVIKETPPAHVQELIDIVTSHQTL